MTRINVVPVDELVNKHLLAEYRELPRIFGYVKKLQMQGKKPDDLKIAGDYILGNGHVKFFTNKINFLVNRQKDLIKELHNRNFNIKFTEVDHLVEGIDKCWFNDYIPTKNAIKINRARIKERLPKI